MSATDRPMDDVPAGLWKWIAGGLAALVAAGVGAVGAVFRWQASAVKEEIKEVRTEVKEARIEVKELDARTGRHFDDIWGVIEAERQGSSRSQERIFTRLEQTPTREEMQKGFERLEALIRGRG